MDDKYMEDYVNRLCGEGSDKPSGVSRDELDEYVKKLRKRPMPDLSRDQALHLIKDKPEIQLNTSEPLHLESTLRENLQRLRKKCGWSYEELAEQVHLDKKVVIGHLKHGKGMQPETLKTYAAAFSEWRDYRISPEDLDPDLDR
jgi:ribosome-binding protein aMBF1 (putative translation factor)